MFPKQQPQSVISSLEVILDGALVAISNKKKSTCHQSRTIM